jgi:hypothetical protein
MSLLTVLVNLLSLPLVDKRLIGSKLLREVWTSLGLREDITFESFQHFIKMPNPRAVATYLCQT